MKKTAFAVAVCALGLSMPVVAQDAVKTAPNNTKVVFENERVRMFEFWGKPGEKLAVHSHPDHVVYVSADGKIKFTAADGTATERDMKAGQALWVPATTHSLEIISGNVRAVVVELKK